MIIHKYLDHLLTKAGKQTQTVVNIIKEGKLISGKNIIGVDRNGRV